MMIILVVPNTNYIIELYKSDDNGNSYINRSLDYTEDNISYIRFDHLGVSDIEKINVTSIYFGYFTSVCLK